jgi:hypothetical protein
MKAAIVSDQSMEYLDLWLQMGYLLPYQAHPQISADHKSGGFTLALVQGAGRSCISRNDWNRRLLVFFGQL